MSPECSVSAFQVKIKMRFEETQIANVKLIPKLPCPGPTAPPGPWLLIKATEKNPSWESPKMSKSG